MECLGITTERHSLDKVVNNSGCKLIELCKGLEIKIISGRFGNDQGVGDFTCQNALGKSVVDYAIAFLKLIHFQIDTFDKCLSDVHTPIWVTLKFDGKLIISQSTQDGSQKKQEDTRLTSMNMT